MRRVARNDLHGLIEARLDGKDRVMVAIAGPPGSGKSTLSAELAGHGSLCAQVVPMDGFHMDNSVLNDLGLLHRKGAPETFDTDAFLQLVRDVRAGGQVQFPVFDRNADAVIENGGELRSKTRVVIFEGNYLLLDRPGWSELSAYWDVSILVDCPMDELERRLIARWLEHGLDSNAARRRAQSNDLVNAKTVLEHSVKPDFVVSDRG